MVVCTFPFLYYVLCDYYLFLFSFHFVSDSLEECIFCNSACLYVSDFDDLGSSSHGKISAFNYTKAGKMICIYICKFTVNDVSMLYIY